ncbi:hypothetical protein CCALI_00069 [Chthonomonas calidirosea T49]|jgi:hypothetical protein
MTVLL